jgi:hypothetical protein
MHTPSRNHASSCHNTNHAISCLNCVKQTKISPLFLCSNRSGQRERERERTCFYSVAGDRSCRQICRRGNARRQRRPTAERDGDYLRHSKREREEIRRRGRENLPERDAGRREGRALYGGEISEREGGCVGGSFPPDRFSSNRKKIRKRKKEIRNSLSTSAVLRLL